MRPVFALAMLALLFLAQPSGGARPDQPAAVHSVTVALDSEQYIVRVSEAHNGTAEVTGIVTVEKLPVERMAVSLSAAVDIGWRTDIRPDTMVFTSTTPQSFSVSVEVPEATQSTATGRLMVSASSSGTGYDVGGTDNATIAVAQYFRVQIESDSPSFETASRGVGTTFRLKVWNAGNGPDTYSLEIANLAKLRSKGWSARLDREVTPVVRPAMYCDVALEVSSPKDFPAFESTGVGLEIRASSNGARAGNETVSQTYTVYFHLEIIEPDFDATVPIIIAAVAVASVAVAIWRWRKRRARRASAAPDPDGPMDVEPD